MHRIPRRHEGKRFRLLSTSFRSKEYIGICCVMQLVEPDTYGDFCDRTSLQSSCANAGMSPHNPSKPTCTTYCFPTIIVEERHIGLTQLKGDLMGKHLWLRYRPQTPIMACEAQLIEIVEATGRKIVSVMYRACRTSSTIGDSVSLWNASKSHNPAPDRGEVEVWHYTVVSHLDCVGRESVSDAAVEPTDAGTGRRLLGSRMIASICQRPCRGGLSRRIPALPKLDSLLDIE